MQVRLEGMWLAQEESLGTSGQKDVMHTNETVTIVTSAVELIMAVNQSDPYIEIREHLNLTGFYLPDGNAHVLGDIPGAVLSIQVLLSDSSSRLTHTNNTNSLEDTGSCLFVPFFSSIKQSSVPFPVYSLKA